MKIKTGAILGSIVVLLGAIIALAPLMSYNFDIRRMQSREFIETQRGFNDVTNLNVSLRGESIEISVNENLNSEYDMLVTLYENENNNRFSIARTNETLNVSKSRSSFLSNIGLISIGTPTTIRIELSSANLLNNLDITGRSGRITLNGLELEELTTSIRSGEIQLNNITVNDELELTSRSGRIEANNVTATEVEIYTRSGRIQVNDSDFDELELYVRSGSASFRNLVVNNLDAYVRSGRIDLGIVGQRGDFTVFIQTRSGRVTGVTQGGPGSPYRVLELEVRSGRIDVSFV